MGEVKQFPRSPRASLLMAEQQTQSDVRQEVGCGVGLMHGTPTDADLFEAAARFRTAANMVENIIAMRQAHR